MISFLFIFRESTNSLVLVDFISMLFFLVCVGTMALDEQNVGDKWTEHAGVLLYDCKIKELLIDDWL